MKQETLQIILQLLNRVTIQGNEVPIFAKIVNEINAEISKEVDKDFKDIKSTNKK